MVQDVQYYIYYISSQWKIWRTVYKYEEQYQCMKYISYNATYHVFYIRNVRDVIVYYIVYCNVHMKRDECHLLKCNVIHREEYFMYSKGCFTHYIRYNPFNIDICRRGQVGRPITGRRGRKVDQVAVPLSPAPSRTLSPLLYLPLFPSHLLPSAPHPPSLPLSAPRSLTSSSSSDFS